MDAVEREILENDILCYFEYMYDIPKAEEFDNEVYYQLYNNDSRYLHVYGGRSAAKSFEAIGKYVTVHLCCLPFCRMVGIRQRLNTIMTSMYQEIIDYIDLWDLAKEFKVTRSPMKIMHKRSKNYIVFRGMDKPETIKSVKDITHVLFEECFEIKDEEGIDKVDKSIRTPKLQYDVHKMIFVYNTDNREHWLYHQFHNPDPTVSERYDWKRSNATMVKTTYQDNKFLPQSIINLIEADKKSNPERWLVDGLGMWGNLQTAGRFYHTFDYGKQVIPKLKDDTYDRFAPLHITLDFNVEPYVSLELAQIKPDSHKQRIMFNMIDEICLSDDARRGKTKETCKEFLKRYRNHMGDVYVHGDRSGNSRKTTGEPDFVTVMDMLRPTPRSHWVDGVDKNGNRTLIDPFPEYAELNCKFKVIDATNQGANPGLAARQKLHENLFAGTLSVLRADRALGTISATGKVRALSRQYGGWLVEMFIDQENCPMLIRDYLEVMEDVLKGGKSDRPFYLTHTSDANDYLVCDILDAELEYIKERMQ